MSILKSVSFTLLLLPFLVVAQDVSTKGAKVVECHAKLVNDRYDISFPSLIRLDPSKNILKDELNTEILRKKYKHFTTYMYTTDDLEMREIRFSVTSDNVSNDEILSYSTKIESIGIQAGFSGLNPNISTDKQFLSDENQVHEMKVSPKDTIVLECKSLK